MNVCIVSTFSCDFEEFKELFDLSNQVIGEWCSEAELIKVNYSIPSISTGAILRDIGNTNSDLGAKVQNYLQSGRLVPDEIIIEILVNRISKDDCSNGFLLDGFPRTIPQAKGLNDILKNNRQKLDAVVSLTANENELIERLIKRGRDSGRSDDTPEIIKQRQEVYWKQTSPLVNFYNNKKLLKEIDGIGEINEIKNRILEALN